MAGKKLAVLCTLLFISVSVFAEAVSFQIIQHDKSHDNVRSSSLLIEDGLFEYFFNQGRIVTNSPVIAFPDDAKDAYYEKKAVAEAREGGVDFLILITADYDVSDSLNSDGNIVDNIKAVSWKIIDIKKDEKLKSGNVIPKGIKAKNMQTGIFQLSQKVAADINAELGR